MQKEVLAVRRIKRLLFERGLTQREVAAKAGVDRSVLSALVNGHAVPYKGWADRISAALQWDGDPAALFEEEGGEAE